VVGPEGHLSWCSCRIAQKVKREGCEKEGVQGRLKGGDLYYRTNCNAGERVQGPKEVHFEAREFTQHELGKLDRVKGGGKEFRKKLIQQTTLESQNSQKKEGGRE